VTGLHELRQFNHKQLSIGQHGDSFNEKYWAGLPRSEQELLANLMARRPPPESTISVCHSEPGAWHLSQALPQRYTSGQACPLRGARFVVGRTMFETDRVPAGWAERLNAADEVWVPTSFARDVFAAGGVRRSKLVVVPEPVDTRFFDPDAYRGANAHKLSVAAQYVSERQRSAAGGGTTFRFLSVGKWERRKESGELYLSLS
jgi:glycosyltransferase involved in cell wall biosynthesis